MSEFFFFMKLFLLTIALVLVMQIQVGERSLESHAMGWVQTSALVQPLNSIAVGGAKVIKDLTAKISGSVSQNSGKKKKEEKKSSSSFRWSHIRSQPDPADHAAD